MPIKRIALLAALTVLALPAAASAKTSPVASSNHRVATGLVASFGTKIDVYNTPAPRGRVVLLHGLSGLRASWKTEPHMARLVDHLRSQGYQVIVPSLPYDTGATQAAYLRQQFSRIDGAQRYQQQWAARFNGIVRWADARYGKAPTIVGGISWGGLHALQAAAANPEIRAYFVHEPVVDPNQLVEFRGLNMNALKRTNALGGELSGKPGFISYGGADTRVGSQPAANLIASLRARGANLRSVEYPTLDHSTDLQSVDNILRWTRTLKLR